MTSYIFKGPQMLSQWASDLYSKLPQNEHGQNVAKISEQINALNAALSDHTGKVFQDHLNTYEKNLKADQNKRANELTKLNGAYYQDPSSLLKQAWDKLVKAVQSALGKTVNAREELDSIQIELSKSTTTDVSEATNSINEYRKLESDRNKLETYLNNLIGLEKTGPSAIATQEELLKEKAALLNRQQELCGTHWGDPKSLLEQAWRSQDGSYETYETERRSNEASLFAIEQRLSVTPRFTLEKLTAGMIHDRVKKLTAQRNTEASKAGIDVIATLQAAQNVALSALSTGSSYVLDYVAAEDIDPNAFNFSVDGNTDI